MIATEIPFNRKAGWVYAQLEKSSSIASNMGYNAQMPWNVIVKKKFSWAHFLTDYHGAPEPVHGHTWVVEVHIKADRVDGGGMGYDFLEVENFLKELLPDYRLLNDMFDFSPSAENMARWIYRKTKERYPTVSRVVVWEKEDCGAEYWED